MVRQNHMTVAAAFALFGVLAGCTQPKDISDPPESQIVQPTSGDFLTGAQVDHLAERILENTPEHVHFVDGTVFSWVFLDVAPQTDLAALQEVVLNKLRERYTVYVYESEIPRHRLIKTDDGRLRGYKEGFQFSYRIEREAEGTIKVHYSDYEGELAASGHWERYRWTGNDWELVEESAMIVA